jgi:Coenzyme PQQ synthesis protein D (PqqD)
VKRSDEVIWREVDGKVVGLDLGSSRYFSLNPSAVELWRLLETEQSEPQLVAALVDSYGLDQAQAQGDVNAFLTVLRENGLLDE